MSTQIMITDTAWRSFNKEINNEFQVPLAESWEEVKREDAVEAAELGSLSSPSRPSSAKKILSGTKPERLSHSVKQQIVADIISLGGKDTFGTLSDLARRNRQFYGATASCYVRKQKKNYICILKQKSHKEFAAHVSLLAPLPAPFSNISPEPVSEPVASAILPKATSSSATTPPPAPVKAPSTKRSSTTKQTKSNSGNIELTMLRATAIPERPSFGELFDPPDGKTFHTAINRRWCHDNPWNQGLGSNLAIEHPPNKLHRGNGDYAPAINILYNCCIEDLMGVNMGDEQVGVYIDPTEPSSLYFRGRWVSSDELSQENYNTTIKKPAMELEAYAEARGKQARAFFPQQEESMRMSRTDMAKENGKKNWCHFRILFDPDIFHFIPSLFADKKRVTMEGMELIQVRRVNWNSQGGSEVYNKGKSAVLNVPRIYTTAQWTIGLKDSGENNRTYLEDTTRHQDETNELFWASVQASDMFGSPDKAMSNGMFTSPDKPMSGM
jgi:hypothetical protein